MPLIDRLERALDSGVDPDSFERAASALLEDRYPWLSPVEAGKDFGRDADIYGVIPGDWESRGRLLATTGNVLSNLKRSHKSWINAQTEGEFRIDALVIATPNPLTASGRRDVEKYCREFNLPLPHFYARRWIINALVKSPHWRETLTGVKGRLDAVVPARLIDTADQPLIGRENLLAEISDIMSRGRDLVLDGVPGVGKSSLLPALGESIYVVEPSAKDYLADDLVAITPSVVALDDAHLHGETLSELARIRVQEGLKFTIVAIAWPHLAADTVSKLPGSEQLRVDLLPSNLMDQLIRNRGVHGVHARRVVLGQAEGRPGWAMLLCDALISRDGVRVLSGEVLLEHAMRCMRQVSESELTVDALACVAALNGASLGDLEVVGDMQKRAGVEVVASINSVAASGLLEIRHDRWHLQPSLRAPIVAHWFFGPQRRRAWETELAHFPSRRAELTFSMLEAAHATEAREVRGAAWGWARSLPASTVWDEPTIGLVREFSMIDSEAGDWASKAARAILATSRELEISPWGTVSDPISIAAQGTLRSCVQAWFNEEAVQGLLDLGVDDHRPRPQHTEHPLRVLGDMARQLDPDRGPLFEIRSMLLRYARTWILQAPFDTRRWAVYCEVLAQAFSPSAAGTWNDPAQLNAYTIANGVETPEHLAELISLWPSAIAPLDNRSGALTAAALVHLIKLFEEWLGVARGHVRGTPSVTSDQRIQAQAGAWAILRPLVPHFFAHPGVALKTWKAVDLAKRWDIHLPTDLDLPQPDLDLAFYVGRREVWEDVDAWIAQRNEEQRRLASRLDSLGPEAGTARLAEMERISAECDLRADGQIVALQLANSVVDPASWIRAAVDGRLATLTYRMVWEARRRRLDIEVDDLRAGLVDSHTRGAIIAAVVDGETLDDVAALIIDQLEASDAAAFEQLFAKNEADPVLLQLLGHPVAEIRAAAALAFAVGVGDGPALPDVSEELWRKAFLDADEETVHGLSAWRLQEMLKSLATEDPDLCMAWFSLRLGRLSVAWRRGRFHDLEGIMGGLPREQRAQLARLASVSPNTLRRFLPFLIGHDSELAAQLLADSTITPEDALSGLSGERDAGVEVLAPVLIGHGVNPHRIARMVCGRRSWAGPESDAVRRDIQWFEDLKARAPALDEVCRAAIADLEHELSHAIEDEKREAVRGWG